MFGAAIRGPDVRVRAYAAEVKQHDEERRRQWRAACEDERRDEETRDVGAPGDEGWEGEGEVENEDIPF